MPPPNNDEANKPALGILLPCQTLCEMLQKKYAPQYQLQWGTDIFLAVGALKANPGLVARALDNLEKASAAAEADTIWNEFLTAIGELTHADTVCSNMP